jgi:hypothetical protein
MINKQKEEEFYAKDFNFSYSSINKLLFSPSLFYKDYILQDKEIRTDKHLVEGKLIHCLLLEPEEFENKFALVPGKTPSDNIRKVMKSMIEFTHQQELKDVLDHVILNALKEMNLYQSLKTDDSRIAKVRVDDYAPYWKFLFNDAVDVIDQDTYIRCQKQVDIIRSNKDVMSLFGDGKVHTGTDFELDPEKRYVEKYLQCSLQGSESFGLHGYIDYYKIDDDTKTVTICDLKTTGKTVSDFPETIDFYNYWLQAAIYMKLVYSNLNEEERDYDFVFKFIVIDKYNQVYVFDVTEGTMGKWAQGLTDTIWRAQFHYNSKDYSLPYQFLTKKQRL